jgi:TPR repeat protein
MQNFLREADTLASLDHPGIVRVLRKFEANGTAYFVMPFVEGVALDELIVERQRENEWFTEIELTGMLSRLLAALDYLHARGIYHRDIKPGNILITSEGVPMLIDFGSARQRLSERSMTVVESAGYTPFEQLQSRGEIGPWSDLYALGATLVKAITGTAPPKAADRVMGDPWQGVSRDAQWMKVYSASFLQSIDQVLFVNPAQRWQSGDEWLQSMSANPSTHHPAVDAMTVVTNLSPLQPPLTGIDVSRHIPPAQSEPTHAPVTSRLKSARKVSKGTRQTLIAGACGLVVIGMALLAIKKSGGNQKPDQAEIPEAVVVPASAAEVEPASSSAPPAEQNDGVSDFYRGEACANGVGVPTDLAEAVRWYQRSADHGHAQAQYKLGRAYLYGVGASTDLVEGVKWFRMAAAQGNSSGQNGVGVCYKNGLGVEKDVLKAVMWFRKATDQGNALAQYNLGDCYYSGIGLPEDKHEAVLWYQKAADQGNALAQNMLGVCRQFGIGLAKDVTEAATWYRKAADQGNAEAQRNLGSCYYYGIGITENKHEAASWYEKSADQGDSSAQTMLGFCYQNGDGLEKDAVKAVSWYRKSANQGNANAQYNMGICCNNGFGLTKDSVQAAKWYQKSAEQGEVGAQFKLGYANYAGQGVPKDVVLAYMWWNLSAVSGDATTKENLEKISKEMTAEQIAEAQRLSREWKAKHPNL